MITSTHSYINIHYVRWYFGVVPTQDCAEQSHLRTAVGETALLFRHWFPPLPGWAHLVNVGCSLTTLCFKQHMYFRIKQICSINKTSYIILK